jgi:beta-lactam-binding protein with PASTA domain
MKTLVRMVLLSLVLLTVALISALTAMRFAIHGREVVVPDVVGMSPLDAERAAQAAGLEIEVQREYYSPTIAEGKIMSQLPGPGTTVRRGFQMRVARSLGPQRVAIPDVTGQTPRAAQINIERRGLDLGTTATLPWSGAPGDQVLAQSPPANASGVSAPRISLLVSAAAQSPAFVMPNFVGQPLGTVSKLIEDAGMRLGKVAIASPDQTSTSPTGQVSANASAAAPAANAGSASAPAPVTTSPPAVPPSPSSLILSQTPPAGQKISPGSTIDFEVSR